MSPHAKFWMGGSDWDLSGIYTAKINDDVSVPPIWCITDEEALSLTGNETPIYIKPISYSACGPFSRTQRQFSLLAHLSVLPASASAPSEEITAKLNF